MIPPFAAVCESCANSASDQTVSNTECKNASTAMTIIIQTMQSMLHLDRSQAYHMRRFKKGSSR